ncbi:embryonic protein UVS.2-like [Scyliorhinus canicula]|uniref:embryonic protein UVS.2-like n=1 Tax=Scyliorhinus canicula TaxID=7830 RepID=UPI0018F38DFC|nr:embryonic protein UVS.2-like [Scyliorhinus canicula]
MQDGCHPKRGSSSSALTHYLVILLTVSELQIQEFAACIGDHLTIYDGSSIHADILEGPTCGGETPAVISTRNELFISFISTRILPATGFIANYKFITCGRMLMTKTGIIKSKPYRTRNMHCFWVLLVKRLYKITLKLEELYLQHTSNCRENSLIIYDAGQPPIAIAGNYCNEVPLPLEVTSTGRTVIIEFLHKKSPTNQGFKISYERLANENPPLFSGSSHEGPDCNKFVVVPFISLIFSQRTILL